MRGRDGWKPAFVIVPALVLAAAWAAFAFWETGRRLLAAAAARAVWMFRVASVAVGQVVPWAVLVAGFAVAAFYALRRARGSRGAAVRRKEPPAQGRAEVWDRRIEDGRASRHARRRLEAELRRLAAEVLTHAEDLEPGDLAGFLARAEAGVPEAVRRLFASGEEGGDGRGFLRRLLPAHLTARARNAASYDLWVHEVVDFLEERMGDAFGNED